MPQDKLGGTWHTVQSAMAWHHGAGVNIELLVRVRFDGYGHSAVNYVITEPYKETLFVEYDAAVEYYNELRRKAETK